MSHGLKNASSTFQNVMNIILQPHSVYADAFIDDIAILSKTFNDHLKHLDAILTDLDKNNITLKLKKCKFAQRHVTCLGHEVGSGKHQPCMDKVSAIKNIQKSHTKKNLKSFLGLAGFHISYIAYFADIALPLTDLTRFHNILNGLKHNNMRLTN